MATKRIRFRLPDGTGVDVARGEQLTSDLLALVEAHAPDQLPASPVEATPPQQDVPNPPRATARKAKTHTPSA